MTNLISKGSPRIMESLDCLMIIKMNAVVSLFLYTMCTTREYIMWMHPYMKSTEQYMMSTCLYMMSTNHYTMLYEDIMW
jgi:hypothetical protein